MSVASTRAETFDGLHELDYSITEAPAGPTLSEAAVADELRDQGWTPEVDGPYAEAWKLYWGKECVTETLTPHAAWIRPLARASDKSIWDEQVQTLLPAIMGDDEHETTLPSCEYISTPWVDELAPTRGRIVVGDELTRINDQLSRNPYGRLHSGVVVVGQAGVGKTYLAYYLLVRQLAAQKMTLFSPKPDLYIFFHPIGVFRASSLQITADGEAALLSVAPENIWIIFDTAPEDGEPNYEVATMRLLFPIQLCRPASEHYDRWQGKSGADFLAIDAPLPRLMLAEALVQVDIRPRKDDLGRLLQHIRDFGPRPRVCFRDLGSLKRKRLELNDYIADLDEDHIEAIAKRCSAGWDFAWRLRGDDQPDIFVLRCNSREGTDMLVPAVSSLHASDRLRHHLDFPSLLGFRDMDVVRRRYEGLENTRNWLFGQLCHSVLSKPIGATFASDLNSPRIAPRLTPCYRNKPGALRLEHLFVARTVRHFNQHLPTFDTAVYCVAESPASETIHAIAYILLSRESEEAAQTGLGAMPRRVTRLSARRAAAEATRDGRRSSATSPISTRSRPQRGPPPLTDLNSPASVRAPNRLVVLFQMVMFGALQVTPSDWTRVESAVAKIKADDISMVSATYCMVFVTSRNSSFDVSRIPKHWSKGMTLYRLELDFEFRFTSN